MGISSISGTSGGISSYGSKGISGLMSGMDVDAIVQGMTSGTSGKIAKLMQTKQSMTWKSDAYRAISSPLIEFSQKYISYTSDTNLSGSSIFAKNAITASGLNSKYLSVSGKSNSADSMHILAVKQLAEDATKSLTGGAKGDITTGEFDLASTTSPVNNVKGQTITVKYDNKEYEIELKDKIVVDKNDSSKDIPLNYDTWGDTVDSINKMIQNDTTLAGLKDKVSFGKTYDDTLKITMATGTTGTLEITGGTGNVLATMGLTDDVKVNGGGSFTADEPLGELITETPVSKVLGEKSMTFVYNGVTKTIKLGKADELAAMTGDEFAQHVQDKLGEAFGGGRVKVDFTEATGSTTKGKLSFTTTKPDATTGLPVADDSSVIKISNADTGLLGKNSLFNLENGASNRVNTSTSAENSGLKGLRDPVTGESLLKTVKLREKDGALYDGYAISINGKGMAFKATDSISDIMSKINSAKAGVKITYNEVSDTFNLKATDGGTSGKIDIKDIDVDINGNFTPPLDTVLQSPSKGNLAEKLFNADNPDTPIDESSDRSVYTDVTAKKGVDAIIEVDFDGVGQGAGSTTITRGNNNFNLDGLNVTVSQVFDSNKKDKDGNYLDKNGAITTDPDKMYIDPDNLVRFTAKADSDKVIEAIKKMAEEYNKLVDDIEKASTQKHNRDYPPLTTEQRKDMSEDEIKAWEEKAKEGLLFNDSTLNSLSSDLRFVFSSYTADDIKSIGISNSGPLGSGYKNNGKITIDEAALRTALAERPDDVSKLFIDPLETKMINGEEEADITTGGVMMRMKAISEKYAGTTGDVKGVLVEKAGNPYAPTSMFSNSIQKANDLTDKEIKRLQTVLKSEESRYYRQFTQLEMLVSQMNSQSSALAGLTGSTQ